MRYTPEYEALQRQLHEDASYGTSGHKHANYIVQLAKQLGTRDILDYGRGKGTLAKSLPWRIQEYDPFVPGYDSDPQPADLVVCSDVLEHIEPECVESVLEHLYELTNKALFVDVACRPAKKTLADGRNAHLIQWSPSEWLAEFLGIGTETLSDPDYLFQFKPVFFQTYEGGFIAVLTK